MESPHQPSHSKEAADLPRKDHGKAPLQRLQTKQRNRSGEGQRIPRLRGGLLERSTCSVTPNSLLPDSSRTVGIWTTSPSLCCINTKGKGTFFLKKLTKLCRENYRSVGGYQHLIIKSSTFSSWWWQLIKGQISPSHKNHSANPTQSHRSPWEPLHLYQP